MKVYKKITLFGWQWYLDDGLTAKPISKETAKQLILNAQLRNGLTRGIMK